MLLPNAVSQPDSSEFDTEAAASGLDVGFSQFLFDRWSSVTFAVDDVQDFASVSRF